MKAAVFHAPGDIRIEEVADPAPGPEDVLIDVAACGICGSDLASWRSGASVTPGQVMGHEIGGTVVSAPAGSGLAVGDAVAVRPLLPCGTCRQCLSGEIQVCENTLNASIGYGLPGGFAPLVLVPGGRAGSSVIVLPAGTEPRHGAVVEPLAVSLRGVRAAEVTTGDIVIVFGLGQIGLGAVLLARLAGAEVVVGVDPSPRRRSAARELGASLVIDPLDQDVTAAVRELTGPGPYGLGAAADAAIEASGIPSAFTAAVKSLRPGGRLSLVAHSKEPFAVKSGRIVEKELTVRGSFGYKSEMSEVVDFMAAGRIPIDLFISHALPLAAISEAFGIQSDAATSLKVLMLP
jgi:(R,R)-butanediol dehydrogenase/meso-butanediol dehydrogenase/diacetyl reductase